MITELPETIRAAMDARLSQAHVALPGTVVSYDATTQTAYVRPGVRRAVPTAVEGEFETEIIPVIPAVPVVWPRGNGQHFAPGLAVGDGVLIVVCDIDPATWVRTGEVSDPGDLRRHDLSHAVCIPGFVPSSQALSPSARDLKVADAEVGGTSDAAALASMLDKLIAVIAAWSPVSGDGGLALKEAVGFAFPAISGSPAPATGITTTGSVVLKVGS